MATTRAGTPLRRTLTTPKIVFLVCAAAAPMAGVVGSVPLAFALGNGAGVPATFVLAGVTLLCFSVGYAAMSRRIVSTGGFYAYVVTHTRERPRAARASPGRGPVQSQPLRRKARCRSVQATTMTPSATG